jgi:hypothetical protein
LRLSQNFSFWNSTLGFRGKSGHLTAFPRACFKTNRVLGKAHFNVVFRRFEKARFPQENGKNNRATLIAD